MGEGKDGPEVGDWYQITWPFSQACSQDVVVVQFAFLKLPSQLPFCWLWGWSLFILLPLRLTSHLAYFHHWFQMCVLQESMRTSSKRAKKKLKRRSLTWRRDGGLGAFRTRWKCEGFKRILWCLKQRGWLLLIDGLASWWWRAGVSARWNELIPLA